MKIATERDLGRPAKPSLGWAALAGSASIAALVPGTLGAMTIGIIPLPGMTSLGFILGAIIGEYYFAKLVPEFFVRTSQVMKFVATSPYVGLKWVGGSPNIVFPEGTLTPTVPFLGREDRGNVPMELITVNFTFGVPGKDAELFVHVTYQYRVDPDQAAGYVGFSDATILAGITPMIKGLIVSNIEGLTLDEAKKKRPTLNTKLTTKFGGKEGSTPTDFEKTYCIVSENVVIEQITVSPTVQASRDSVAQSEQQMRAAAIMFNMTPEELKTALDTKVINADQLRQFYDLALVQSGKATKTLTTNRFEGLDDTARAIGEGIINAIMASKK